MKSTFRARLQEMMGILNVTKTQVADRSGLHKSGLTRYFQEEYDPKIETVNAIANAFGVNPVWLMGYDAPMYENDIGSVLPYNLSMLQDFILKLNEKERETALNVLKAMFPNK